MPPALRLLSPRVLLGCGSLKAEFHRAPPACMSLADLEGGGTWARGIERNLRLVLPRTDVPSVVVATWLSSPCVTPASGPTSLPGRAARSLLRLPISAPSPHFCSGSSAEPTQRLPPLPRAQHRDDVALQGTRGL